MNLLQVHVPEELLSYTFSDFDGKGQFYLTMSKETGLLIK